MFDDFRPDSTNRQARKRFGGSMAAAVVIYGSSSAILIGATATARHVVEEELTQVEFAPPPEPEPPPPEQAPPPEVAAVRPKVKRPKLTPPKEVPLEKPKESDAPLAAAEEHGQDGSLDGVEGGTGTGRAAPPPPPPPKPEKTTPPVPAGNFESTKPDYPKSARRKGIEGSVVVAFEVATSGAVVNPRIVSGPEEFHSAVLKMVLKWRYKPARRGSQFVPYRLQRRITFRLEDA